VPLKVTTIRTPAERRAAVARRVDFAREALRPFLAEDSYEGRLIRRADFALAAAAAELVDDDDDASCLRG
jgi:hypothetical protein